MTVQYIVGDVFERMAQLEDGSVDLVLTSPPFLALRSYLPADHPDKHKEIGSEATPAEFIDVLLKLTAEWRRLLTPHGSICVELGDTYSGARGYGQPEDAIYGERHERLWEEAKPSRRFKTKDDGWPLAKSLTLVPEAYRFALAYGLNPHTGQPSPAGQWRIRNVIRWVRPNPPVGALGDKFRPATSELVVACVSKDRWFDLDAVRYESDYHRDSLYTNAETPPGQRPNLSQHTVNPAGAPPLDWWKISPKGFSGAHYAVWPSELCVKPIKAMCPREVCRECGEPRRRITEWTDDYKASRAAIVALPDPGGPGLGYDKRGTGNRISNKQVTVGWSDCGHDNYRPGLVLDPFAGTGVTGMVADGHGRDAVLIDIDARNYELARSRIGPLLFDASNPTDVRSDALLESTSQGSPGGHQEDRD